MTALLAIVLIAFFIAGLVCGKLMRPRDVTLKYAKCSAPKSYGEDDEHAWVRPCDGTHRRVLRFTYQQLQQAQTRAMENIKDCPFA